MTLKVAAAVAVLFLATTAAGRTGDGFVLRPAEQPLLVLRAAKADAVSRLAGSSQARALGAEDGDFSGGVPGTAVRLESLRAFLGALGDKGTENVWYYLAQPGGMLSQPVGALGWRAAPGADNDSVAWLQSVGVSVSSGKFVTQNLPAGGKNVIIAADAPMLEKMSAGGRGGNEWRGSLARFLDDDDPDGVGAWFSTRPLLGIATLATGLDFRTLFRSAGLNLPHSARIKLAAGTDDLGVEVRLDGVFPEEDRAEAVAGGVLVVPAGENLLTLGVTAPEDICRLIDLPQAAFAAANLDRDAVIPESVTLSVWKSGGGDYRWLAVALMKDLPQSGNQLRRLALWLKSLAGRQSALPRESAAGIGGDALRLGAGGGPSLFFKVADWKDAAGGDRACLLITDREDNLLHPGMLKARQGSGGSVVEWDIRLDAELRSRALAALEAAADGKLRLANFNALLPREDTGHIGKHDGALVANSRTGLTPMLAPLFRDLGDALPRPANPMLKTASAQLRFLLEVAGQSRFRNLSMTDSARAWPEDWIGVVGNGATDRRWLDTAFSAFPRGPGGRPNSMILSQIADGQPVSGVLYRIAAGAEGWRIVALVDDAPTLRIDAGGRLEIARDGSWEAWEEPIVDWFSN